MADFTLVNQPKAPADSVRWPTPREILLNAAGLLLPIAVAVLALPILTGNLGLSRFGALSLLLGLLTYLGVLDLGLGSAVAYRAAVMLATGLHREVPEMVRTVAAVAIVLGTLVATAVYLVAPAALPLFGANSSELHDEIVRAIRVLGWSAPAMFLTALLGGVQSAYGDFIRLNYVRISVGFAFVMAPAVASFWTRDLEVLASFMLIARTLGALVQLIICASLVPRLLTGRVRCSLSVLRPMLRFGGWMTVSNFIGPFMIYMDRFYLGVQRSLHEVAHYVTPYELATKISLVPAALLPVLFPRMVAAVSWGASDEDGRATTSIAKLVALGCAVPAAILAAMAPEVMLLWMGNMLPPASAVVLQILAPGVLVNCLAQVFFLRVQAGGRAELIAWTHLGEISCYLVVLWILTSWYGLVGVACAWSLRVIVDAAIFCAMTGRLLPSGAARECRRLYGVTLAYALALMATALIEPWWLRLLFALPPLMLVVRRRDMLTKLRF